MGGGGGSGDRIKKCPHRITFLTDRRISDLLRLAPTAVLTTNSGATHRSTGLLFLLQTRSSSPAFRNEERLCQLAFVVFLSELPLPDGE